MASLFYVGRDNKKFGPFSGEQLQKLAKTGRLLPADTVWKEGTETPVLAARVKNLFPPAAAPEAFPEDARLVPLEAPVTGTVPATVQPVPVPAAIPPASSPPPPKPVPAKKKRAVVVKGAVLISQDGVTVYYRKKCVKCGHEDASRSSMHITAGTNRANFFCPKCRKNHEVLLQGMMQ